MRILWLTSAFPDTQGTGGTVHEYELLRSAAEHHQITLLSTFWMIRPEALREVQEMGVRVEVVPWPWREALTPHNRLLMFFRLLRGAAPTLQIWKGSKRCEALARAVIAEENAGPVDMVFVVQGELAPVLDACRAPTALLLYDIHSRQTALVSGELSVRAVRHRLERRNARRWERVWYAKADAVACVSAVDAELASTMLGRPVETIENPVPEEFFSPPAVPRSPTRVTIIGSFGWEPNIDSVRWMCADIWPRVIKARPDARLRVVGRYASQELQDEVEAVGGEFFRDVEDIRPYYWDAAVVAANIRMGSGMRNKVLHAMACRAPLVATTSALEGITAAAGEHLLVADEAAGIADAIIATLNDPAAAAARAEAATAVASQYSSAAAGLALERWWESSLAGRQADGQRR